MSFYRKIIHIAAEDSPNVKLGLEMLNRGLTPTGEDVLPGPLSWREYVKRMNEWDAVKKCIGLGGRFWEGDDLLLYPPDWLDHSEEIYRNFQASMGAVEAIGCDPGEGVASTVWALGNRRGLVELIARKTPDTSEIVQETKDILNRSKVPFNKVYFDRGGGGKQIADMLRRDGYKVQTVSFGERPTSPPKRGRSSFEAKVLEQEESQMYKSRRAQMYWWLRLLMDPTGENGGFAISQRHRKLREQLAVMPLLRDGEDRIWLPPKNKSSPNSTERTLIDIIGYSPDEADALVTMVFALLYKPTKRKIRAV